MTIYKSEKYNKYNLGIKNYVCFVFSKSSFKISSKIMDKNKRTNHALGLNKVEKCVNLYKQKKIV